MSEVKKEVIEINGKKFLFPNPTEEQLPFGMKRKIRKFKTNDPDAGPELIFLLLEFFLSSSELEAWDYLSGKEMEEAIEAIEKIDFLTK